MTPNERRLFRPVFVVRIDEPGEESTYVGEAWTWAEGAEEHAAELQIEFDRYAEAHNLPQFDRYFVERWELH